MSKQREALEFALEWIEAQPEPRMIGALSTIQTIREALAEQEQEPTADNELYAAFLAGLHSKKTPRKPLTDEQVVEIALPFVNSYGDGAYGIHEERVEEFARAIERAHGITDD